MQRAPVIGDADGFGEFRQRHPEYGHLTAEQINEYCLSDRRLAHAAAEYCFELQGRAVDAREERARHRDALIAQAEEALSRLRAERDSEDMIDDYKPKGILGE